MILFFLYYFLAIALALYRLVSAAFEDPSGPGWALVYGAGATYAIATIWGLFTLIQHWRSLISGREPRNPVAGPAALDSVAHG